MNVEDNPNPIFIDRIYQGAIISWSQDDCGFGQLSFKYDEATKTLVCDDECMGREWIRKALYALADHVADTATLIG